MSHKIALNDYQHNRLDRLSQENSKTVKAYPEYRISNIECRFLSAKNPRGAGNKSVQDHVDPNKQHFGFFVLIQRDILNIPRYK